MPPTEWTKFVPPPRPLADGEKWNVFLSYRSANRAWVLSLYDVLREYGHKVFLDQVALAAGDELITRLEDALRGSQAGVLVWSNAARDSDWVRKEYQVMERQTTKRAFRFVPVQLDSTALPDFAESHIFLNFQAYPDGPNGGELLRLLHGVIGLPLTPEAARFALEQDEASSAAAAQIAAAVRNGRPERLQELFAAGGLPWQSSATLACKVAEGLTKLGADDAALDVLQRVTQSFPRAIRPKQLRAHALDRRARKAMAAKDNAAAEKDIFAAQDILGELYERGERDPETLGLYGATWNDRYRLSGNSSDLKQSRDYYLEAFQGAQDDYYTGINAAAKSVFLATEEDLATAAEVAARVQKIVGTEPHKDDYWQTATVGQLFLIRRNYAEAARLYAAAVAMARQEKGSHESTWREACALMARLKPSDTDRARIRKVFEHLPDCDAL
jgi:hypothetical protein